MLPFNTAREGWHASLLGDFELIAPSGDKVHLPTRKVEAVFAALVLESPRRLRRSRLASMIWPDDDPAKARTSLRQAFAMLRRSVAPELLVGDAEHCWLNEKFPLHVDVWRVQEAIFHGDADLTDRFSNLILLREWDYPWLAEKRQALAEDLGSTQAPKPKTGDGTEPPVEALLQTIEWLADSNPAAAMRLVVDSFAAAIAAEPGRLCRIVRKLSSAPMATEHLSGWLRHLQSCLAFSSEPLSTILHLERDAARLGRSSGDLWLEAEAMLNYGAATILIGQPQKGLAMASQVLERTKDPKGIIAVKMGHLRAISLAHLGFIDEGDAEFRRILEDSHFESDPVDKAVSSLIRAFFLATTGRREAAEAICEDMEAICRVSSLWRLKTLFNLVRGYCAFDEQRNEDAEAMWQRAVALSQSRPSNHIALYCREALATLAWSRGDAAGAAKSAQECSKTRTQLAMGFTKWDRMRVGEVAHLFSV